MSLDAETSTVTRLGTVTIMAGGNITIVDSEGKNCTCRDVAVWACIWAIGELQREVIKDIESPGGSDRIVIG